jgi:hypothetical protein
MVRLRTSEGFRWETDVPNTLGGPEFEVLQRSVARATSKGRLQKTSNGFVIPPEQWMQSDAIIAELFLSPLDH